MDVAFGGRGKLDMPSPHPLSAACFQREDVPAGRCPTTLDHLWGTTLFFFFSPFVILLRRFFSLARCGS